jgi:hypothetical protein
MQEPGVITGDGLWDQERLQLLGKPIAELGLRIQGTKVEQWVDQLYRELDEKGLVFRPQVYLTDEWGCPTEVPVIGVPFFYADPRLERIEREHAVVLEEEADPIRILRHEAGHAFNYAYRLYDRPEWRRVFGPYSRPYRDRFRVDPFSRQHVRHILGWYAQKHPDEDFAETFAVWLTPGSDWRERYKRWPALRKLKFVDRLMYEVGAQPVPAAVPLLEHMPVEAMRGTLEEHYQTWQAKLPIQDETNFDADLHNIFTTRSDEGEDAGAFIRRHRKELVGRIAYWTGETGGAVRQFVDFLAERAHKLGLRTGPGDPTLIELTAFGTAVIMNYRYTDTLEPEHQEDS